MFNGLILLRAPERIVPLDKIKGINLDITPFDAQALRQMMPEIAKAIREAMKKEKA